MPSNKTPSPILWEAGQLQLLDQRKLPHEEIYLNFSDAPCVATAITDMVVRGAPAIGIAAAYAMVLSFAQHGDNVTALNNDFNSLAASRPTAVNLFWALERMRGCWQNAKARGVDVLAMLTAEALAIHEEDRLACAAMGRLGAGFLSPGSAVYTHCNAGALATGGEGTSLAVVREAHRRGNLLRAFVGETRPWMQGSRLTAWELQREGIPLCISTESGAATLFRSGRVQWVIVGADRITRRGDVANKVGTYPLAVLARHHGVKFMVVAPRSTIDQNLQSGDEIPIEQRPSAEVTHYAGKAVAPLGCEAFNPSFDVTPAELIDVLVTETTAIVRPSLERMAPLLDP